MAAAPHICCRRSLRQQCSAGSCTRIPERSKQPKNLLWHSKGAFWRSCQQNFRSESQ